MKVQHNFSLKNVIIITFTVLCLMVICGSNVATAYDDINNPEQLNENKKFITDTFNAIGENLHVSMSSMTESAKTAEPELYNSMLSRGEELLPAALDLLADNLKEGNRGRRTGELAMLCNDILESMAESEINSIDPVTGWYSDETFIASFSDIYEKYLGFSAPYIPSHGELQNLADMEFNKLKEFIMDTFDKISENPLVSESSMVEIAKTAEPELYDSMLSREDIFPAVVSLLAENDPGRRGAEISMLHEDMWERWGTSLLTYCVWWTKVDPSVYIPEPDNSDNPPPDYLRWEPMLDSYIYADAHYIPELGMIVLEKWPDIPPEPIYITVSVRPDSAGSAAASSEEAEIGDIITLRYEAAEGYRFKEWNVIRPSEGLVITDNSFIVPYEDVKIQAVFEAIPR